MAKSTPQGTQETLETLDTQGIIPVTAGVIEVIDNNPPVTMASIVQELLILVNVIQAKILQNKNEVITPLNVDDEYQKLEKLKADIESLL